MHFLYAFNSILGHGPVFICILERDILYFLNCIFLKPNYLGFRVMLWVYCSYESLYICSI
ncbi:hypothetical protein HanRHA438_Chr06g0258911 [Helianthus annuus]|nr:hypothetical protein HanRHA438_Chr06g0258911 [Helianthus annuus]